MNEARRRRQKQGRTPVAGRKTAAVASAPQSVIPPPPWSRRSALILGIVAFVLQFVSAVITANAGRAPRATTMVFLVDGQAIVMIFSFPLAEPIARRIARESRRLRFGETMAAAAVTAILFYGIDLIVAYVGLLLKRPAVLDGGHPIVLALLTTALFVSCLGGPLGAPYIQRLFVPRRKPSSRVP